MAEDDTALPLNVGQILAAYGLYEAKAAALISVNKATILAALAKAGVTSVIVRFDGCGDSGQIEEIEASKGDEAADVPSDIVALSRIDHMSNEGPRSIDMTVGDAIEALCYDLLASQHGGWENNGGAFGEFTFDVAADSIALEFSYRIESTEDHSHLF